MLSDLFQVTAVHLIDSFHCTSAANYISVVLLSLSTMMHLELPHVNVLSKIDMIERYGKLSMSPLLDTVCASTNVPIDFSLEFYTEVQDLSYLQRTLDRNLDKNFRRLNKALCELIEDYALVSFVPLNIQVRRVSSSRHCVAPPLPLPQLSACRTKRA